MAKTTLSGKARPQGAKDYKYPESTSLMRPDVGTQAQFKKRRPAKTFRYDNSLSPSLQWDGQNAAREQGEALIRQALGAKTLEEAKSAASKLKAMSTPFLDWAGKAERLSFEVPTLPLFVHERLSTKAILETLKGHRFDRNQKTMLDLWGDPQHSITDQVLRAYEHKDKWVNRMILGDSLVVMNSLLHYEGLGGQVQMVYIDPPYGVKFGSNFQPFVRKRDVSHGDDGDMTREPEMVQAYRDTWELGLHSYMTYLRDRLLLARDLLSPTGSIFVQIGDENVHHVREAIDEVFGSENCLGLIFVAKTSGFGETVSLASVGDYLLWYARDASRTKYRQLFLPKDARSPFAKDYKWLESPDGKRRPSTSSEMANPDLVPVGWRHFSLTATTSQGATANGNYFVEFNGKVFRIPPDQHWKTSEDGLKRLIESNRIHARENSLRYIRYLEDFPVTPITNNWTDLRWGYDAGEKRYVVETNPGILTRCILMTTDPGDLVVDPTCGSGTTAYCAEQWGRRWITIDTSRVPLALARQRLLTATFPWYELQDDSRGPAGGFIYKRRQNKKGEEVGGVVPHVTLKSIANNEPPEQEVLADRPEERLFNHPSDGAILFRSDYSHAARFRRAKARKRCP